METILAYLYADISTGFLLQWIRSMTTATYIDATDGIIYYPILFPNRCLCHLATGHQAGDFITLRNTTSAQVEFSAFERINNGAVGNGFDLMALGH